MMNSIDVTGRRSRTMTTAQIIAIIGALQTGLPLFGAHIPPDWQWLYGVALCFLGVWLAYLRNTTTTAME